MALYAYIADILNENRYKILLDFKNNKTIFS